jgi:4a-hydroxytetrahydrobiopterin dehydratase
MQRESDERRDGAMESVWGHAAISPRRVPCTAQARSDIMHGARATDDPSPTPMPTRLSDLEIQRALGTLPGWSRRRNVLSKTFTSPTFAEAIEFVNRVAKLADAANHHPDIDIRYTKVTCTLSTHDAGGITEKDLALAGEIERAV